MVKLNPIKKHEMEVNKMHILLYVNDASNEEETVRLDNLKYETVIDQITEAKKNSSMFEYIHHRNGRRVAVNPERIVKVVERP